MGQGIDAVRTELESDFDITDLLQRFDVDREVTAISFKSEGRLFVASVSKEFDDDYPSGIRPADLSRLGQVLRASKTGRAVVKNSGILPD